MSSSYFLEHDKKFFILLNSNFCPMYSLTIYPPPHNIVSLHRAVHTSVEKFKTNKPCAKAKNTLILVPFFNDGTTLMDDVIFSLSFSTLLYSLVKISIGVCK